MRASVRDHQIRRPGCGSAIADGLLCISLSTNHISAGKESCTGSRKARSGTCFERQQGQTAGISAQGRSGSASDIAARRYRQPAHIGKALLWAAWKTGATENTYRMSHQIRQRKTAESFSNESRDGSAFADSLDFVDLMHHRTAVPDRGRRYSQRGFHS